LRGACRRAPAATRNRTCCAARFAHKRTAPPALTRLYRACALRKRGKGAQRCAPRAAAPAAAAATTSATPLPAALRYAAACRQQHALR